jgi:hypothetical protein
MYACSVVGMLVIAHRFYNDPAVPSSDSGEQRGITSEASLGLKSNIINPQYDVSGYENPFRKQKGPKN